MDSKVENRGSYIYVQVSGELKKDDESQYNEARRIALEVIKLADQTGITKIFCDAESLSGEISFATRVSFSLFLVNQNIEQLKKRKYVFQVAFLTRSEIIDPGKIAVAILRNRGVNVLVTTDMPEAVRWLGIDTPVKE